MGKTDITIWLYAIFGNEAELMPYFLRHYAPLCDRLILFDNDSTDQTADIARAYMNVTIEAYPPDKTGLDSEAMAQFSREQYKQARGRADYVIWVDCDEFLWSGPIGMRELLRGYKAQGIRAVKSIGYQMITDQFPTGDAPLIEQVCTGIRDETFDKVAIIDPGLDLYWKPGRHVCKISGFAAYRGEVRLLHYRYLGADYYARRNAYNFTRKSQREIETGRSYNSDPAYTSGKYSAAWFQDALSRASDVVNQDWIGV